MAHLTDRLGPVRLHPMRYEAAESACWTDQWVIVDTSTGLLVRRGSRPTWFDSLAEAEAKAEQLSTARIVCRSCRHKALAADCKGRQCPACVNKQPPPQP